MGLNKIAQFLAIMDQIPMQYSFFDCFDLHDSLCMHGTVHCDYCSTIVLTYGAHGYITKL